MCLQATWPTPWPCADGANKACPLPTISYPVHATKTAPKEFQVESRGRRKYFCLPSATWLVTTRPWLWPLALPLRHQSALEKHQTHWQPIATRPWCLQCPAGKVQATGWHRALATLLRCLPKRVAPTTSVCRFRSVPDRLHALVGKSARALCPCDSKCAQTDLPPHRPRCPQ